jgi:hypothetical protein
MYSKAIVTGVMLEDFMKWIVVVLPLLFWGLPAACQGIAIPDYFGIKRGWEINESCHDQTRDSMDTGAALKCGQKALQNVASNSGVAAGLIFGIWFDAALHVEVLERFAAKKGTSQDFAKKMLPEAKSRAMDISRIFFEYIDGQYLTPVTFAKILGINTDQVEVLALLWRSHVRVDSLKLKTEPKATP